MKKIETKAAKFEAGKTYFANWTACDGSDQVSTFMIEKRSAHSVTINGKRYMIPKIEGHWEYPAVEFIRATAEDGFHVYVEACDVFTTEANPDDYAVSQEAMDVAVDAETKLANSEAQTSTPIINIADYNTMMTWAEKISNGQRDAVTPIVTYLSKLGYTADKQDVFNAIDTDDLNGFRRYISQFPFLVKDDADYIQKLYAQEDGQVVLAEVPTCEYPNAENNAPEFAVDAETKLANAANANKTAKTQIKEKSPMIIAISREAEKMTISAGTGKAKVKKYFVDGEKMTRGQTEIVIRSYVQSAIETGATIEIDNRLANEFDAIANTPYKGEINLVYVDESGKPVKADDEKQGMFADSVDATPYHAKIIMFGDKVPMFQIICNGRELNSNRGGHSLSQKEVGEWIIKTYQMRKQYPNMKIEVPRVVAALYLDSFASNPRIIRELNVTLTKLEEKAADVDPSEYATTAEAMDVAVDAETKLANAANVKAIKEQIAHIKSDIRYREGALKDLEENHLAKYPNDESLKELRAEWVNELSDLKATLAKLENGEAKAVAEAKEAVKERDTEFEKAMTEIRFFTHCMDVKSLKNQIADVENEINSLVRMINRAGKTYGTPAYDPDDDEEFINNLGEDLVDELNKLANLKATLAKLAPYEANDDSDADDADTDNGVEAKAENKTVDAEKTDENKKCFVSLKTAKNGSLITKVENGYNSSRKFQDAADTIEKMRITGGEVQITVERNNGSFICDSYKGGYSAEQGKIVLTDRAGNEYSFRGYNANFAIRDFAKGIFGRFITVKPAITEADPAEYAVIPEAIEIAINAELDAATANALNEELSDTIGNLGNNTPESENVFQSKLAELQDEYDAATLEHEKAIDAVKAAEKALQAARELEQIAAGKRIKAGNVIYHFGSAKAAELHEKILPIEITNRPSMIITNQFNCRRNIYLETLFIAFYEYKFSIIADTDYGTCTLGEYDTPAQVERVIKMLKAAVARGDKDFIFPTVEELSGINEKAARRKTG